MRHPRGSQHETWWTSLLLPRTRTERRFSSTHTALLFVRGGGLPIKRGSMQHPSQHLRARLRPKLTAAHRAHLIHDLRPYVCTYENCETPGQPYESRHDWVRHENANHRKIWRCLEHADQAFKDINEYQIHLEAEHALHIGSASMNRIAHVSELTSAVMDRPCPVCSVVLDTPKALHSHIALHLERLAFFSLPRSTGSDEDNDDDLAGSKSDMAQGMVGSRDEDFEEPLDFDRDQPGDEDLGADLKGELSGHDIEVVDFPNKEAMEMEVIQYQD
jgi:hypothetical protein